MKRKTLIAIMAMGLLIVVATMPLTPTAAADGRGSEDVTSNIMKNRRNQGKTTVPAEKAGQVTCQPVSTEKCTATTDPVAENSKDPPHSGAEACNQGSSTFFSGGMTAEEVAKQAMTAPPSGTRWDHFHEVSAYVGYYHNFGADTNGFWAMLEYIRWNTQRQEPKNYGYGLTVKAGYGWGKNDGVHWGSIDVGPNLDYWQELTLDQYLLFKLRLLYRFGEANSGFAPGAYLEYDYILGRNDTGIVALDGQYFPDDSYFGLSLMLKHRFSRNLEVKGGLCLTLLDLKDETLLGIGPSISAKFYNRFVLGASLNFIKGGPTLGLYAGYELNTDLVLLDAKVREKSVSKKSSGITAEMPTEKEGPQLTRAGDTYMTLPGTTEGGMEISDKPLQEEQK